MVGEGGENASAWVVTHSLVELINFALNKYYSQQLNNYIMTNFGISRDEIELEAIHCCNCL